MSGNVAGAAGSLLFSSLPRDAVGVEPQRADAELIGRILAGERELYAELVVRYQDTLFRHALAMVGDRDAAADLVQDSMVKAFTRLHTCEPDRFGAWVFRIVRNRCKDWLKNRRQHTTTLEADDYAAPESDDPVRTLERTELGRVVQAALMRLPAAQREAFLLKHVDGLSYEEMAERLETGVSALKMRVMRAREALQEILRDVV
jgi:RNA polymerase sigma-70 factor, ECF subfamily